MVARCSSALPLLVAALAIGCAAQREARVRRAWSPTPSDASGPADSDSAAPSADNGRDASVAAPKFGWARVEELLTRATDVLTTAPSPEVLAELATKWCEVEPVPRQTRYGEVRVCYLYPPVRVEGVALTLELSDEGIIGFVAPELEVAKSQEIAKGARRTLGHLCEGEWARSSTELDLQTCIVDGGSTLAVGRLQQRPDEERWQVSIAILGAI